MNNLILYDLSRKLTKEDYYKISERLNLLKPEFIKDLYNLNLKSPILGLLIGVLFGVFGLDRLYKGDFFIAYLKLFLLTIYFICYSIFINPIYADIKIFTCVFIIVISLILISFYFLDLAFVYKGIKDDNYIKLCDFLRFKC